MHGTEPMIARTACVAVQAGRSLHFDGRAPIFCECNDEACSLRIGRVLRARTVAGFAYRNPRIGTIGDVQAERMQGVGEVLGFEPMTGDAGFLADRLGVGS